MTDLEIKAFSNEVKLRKFINSSKRTAKGNYSDRKKIIMGDNLGHQNEEITMGRVDRWVDG